MLSKNNKLIYILVCLMLVFSVVAEDVPVDDSIEESVEEVPVEETPTEEIPVEEEIPLDTPVEEPVEETPEEEVPLEEPVVDEPVIDTPIDETPPVEEEPITPEENSTEEIPVEEEPVVDEPVEEIVIEEPSLFTTLLNLVLDKLIILKGELLNIQASLTYENESPIADQEVDFYFDAEKIGTDVTDESGVAEVEYDTSSNEPGTYIIEIDFPGNSELDVSSDSVEVTIEIEEAEEIVEVVNETILEVIVENVTEEIVIENVTEEIIEVDLEDGLPIGVDRIEDCVDVEYDFEEYEYCTEDVEFTICDDEPINKSCHIETKQNKYICSDEKKVVKKIRKECKTEGFTINNVVQLNTQNYECSVEEVNGQIITTCDGKFDGNGDGICTSGESCMKFVVDGDKTEKYEKNSRDDFIEEDESFFLERASTEVLK